MNRGQLCWLVPLFGVFLGLQCVPRVPEANPQHSGVSGGLKGNWEADVQARLIELIQTRGRGSSGYDASKPPVVVFDFDNTCVRGDLGRAFFDFMVTGLRIHFREEIFSALPEKTRGVIRETWAAIEKLPSDSRAGSREARQLRKLMHQSYWNLCQETNAAQCYPWQVRFYADYSPDEISRLAKELFDQELKRPLGSETLEVDANDTQPSITATGLRVHPEIRQLVGLLREQGFDVWIVSAGPQWVVKAAAPALGVLPDHVLGMRTKLVDGKLSSEIDPPTTFREGKVQAIQKFIGRRPVLALGDSWTDFEMLKDAEHAILLDRGYEDLKRACMDAGAWIQPNFPTR